MVSEAVCREGKSYEDEFIGSKMCQFPIKSISGQ